MYIYIAIKSPNEPYIFDQTGYEAVMLMMLLQMSRHARSK